MLESVMSKYKDDIIKSLSKLVAIESVANTNGGVKKYPFGLKSAEAIEFMTSLASEMGFDAHNCDNYACHAQFGDGDDTDYAAVLTHVDVVPVGDGWNSNPLELTEKDGYLYGRGVADDKGAAIVSLYCLKAMKDNGVELKRPVRCIFGGGEEIGMDDMEYYFKLHGLPAFAFTPDADYPVCNCEKGIMHLKFSAPADKRVLGLYGGSAINCVADICTAEISCDCITAQNMCNNMQKLGLKVEFTSENNICRFSVGGVSSHAMCPEKGKNAVDGLIIAANLSGIFSEYSAEKFFAESICGGLHGEKIGIDCSDDVSGDLTMNVGEADVSDGFINIKVDIRYPVTIESSEIIKKITFAARKYNVSVEIITDNKPLYIPESHPLIQTLGECYTEVTGQPVHPISMGGGTYARTLGGRGVAFGMAFPDSEPTNIHMANEKFSVKELMLHAEICYKSMCRMAVLDKLQ